MSKATVFAPAPAGNLLSDASDAQLFNLQIFLNLGCQKQKLATREAHRAYFCYLARIVLPEFSRRGVTPPTDSDGVQQLKKA